MKTNKRIDDEVEKTFQSIDGIERATPKPFFLTRVEARLDRHQAAPPQRKWIFRPAYILASLGLVALLNVSAVLVYEHQLRTDEQQQTDERFAAEWRLETNTSDW